MESLNMVDLSDLNELEEMICLDNGGTISCCNGGDGNTSADIDV